jgi:hypothetical protein
MRAERPCQVCGDPADLAARDLGGAPMLLHGDYCARCLTRLGFLAPDLDWWDEDDEDDADFLDAFLDTLDGDDDAEGDA